MCVLERESGGVKSKVKGVKKHHQQLCGRKPAFFPKSLTESLCFQWASVPRGPLGERRWATRRGQKATAWLISMWRERHGMWRDRAEWKRGWMWSRSSAYALAILFQLPGSAVQRRGPQASFLHVKPLSSHCPLYLLSHHLFASFDSSSQSAAALVVHIKRIQGAFPAGRVMSFIKMVEVSAGGFTDRDRITVTHLPRMTLSQSHLLDLQPLGSMCKIC